MYFKLTGAERNFVSFLIPLWIEELKKISALCCSMLVSVSERGADAKGERYFFFNLLLSK